MFSLCGVKQYLVLPTQTHTHTAGHPISDEDSPYDDGIYIHLCRLPTGERSPFFHDLSSDTLLDLSRRVLSSYFCFLMFFSSAEFTDCNVSITAYIKNKLLVIYAKHHPLAA